MTTKDINPDLFNVDFREDEDGWDNRMIMEIHRMGKMTDEHYDGGEPEDNSFGRDWSWVSFAIEQAYLWGVEDGKSGEYSDINA